MASGAERVIRLLTYNIQAGTGTGRYQHYVTHGWKHVLPNTRRMETLDAMAETLSEYDIVGLQEADAGSLRSGFLNQTKYLAERAGFPFWSHQPNRKVGNIAVSANGLLARTRPFEITDHRLPGRLRGRGALLVKFGESARALVVVILHLALGKRARANQFSFVRDLIAEFDYAIVMGDMNCPVHSREMDAFLNSTHLHLPEGSEHTFPSWRPQRGIDHILISDQLSAAQFCVLDLAFSDHRPVAMDVRLPNDCEFGHTRF